MLAELDVIPQAIDFDGVESISYSFADEFVGKLLQRSVDQRGTMPRLASMAPAVEEAVALSLDNRQLKPERVEFAA